jgi:Rifampin ADP-ribosyl transferase
MSAAKGPVPFEVYDAGVYFTATLDAATWGVELAAGEGRGHIYIVEPSGEFEDDPNLTNKRLPGNPTQSFRTREPLRLVGELVDWVGHSPESSRPCGTDSTRCSGRAQRRSRIEYAARDATFGRVPSILLRHSHCERPDISVCRCEWFPWTSGLHLAFAAAWMGYLGRGRRIPADLAEGFLD